MLLLIDKPKGLTSHDVVDRVRKIVSNKLPSQHIRRIKVGHAGTLDPNATGLLIVGVGRESTKLLEKIAKNTTKTYKAEIYLGEERDTHDVEGQKIPNSNFMARSTNLQDKLSDNAKVSKLKIIKVLNTFLGEQNQLPPRYSAIKVKGKKAYELARAGKDVKLKPRKITIHSIELISYKYPLLKIQCEASSGTYIRSLARDIGRRLGCGAYLNELRRQKIGKYEIEKSVSLDELENRSWEKLASEVK